MTARVWQKIGWGEESSPRENFLGKPREIGEPAMLIAGFLWVCVKITGLAIYPAINQ